MKTLLILALISVVSVPVLASGIPDLFESYVVCAYEGTEHVIMLNLPNGTGSSFQNAHDSGGGLVDATITLFLLDNNQAPISDFPMEDMWLQSEDGGLSLCVAGSTADANTDMLGMTQWVYPLHAGGYSQAPLEVLVNGMVIQNPPNLPISFNSPDSNGDGWVNLVDVTNFSVDFFGAYNFRSDFHPDGLLNLVDVSLLAYGVGTSCP
jgi:hypothetical protein